MLKKLFSLVSRVTYFGIEQNDSYLQRFRKRVLNRTFVIVGCGCLLLILNAILAGNPIQLLQPIVVAVIAFASLLLTYFNYFRIARFILTFFLPSLFLGVIMLYGSGLKLDYTIAFFTVLVLTMYDKSRPLIINLIYLIALQGFSYYFMANYESPYAAYVDPYDSITIMLFTTIGLFVLVSKFIRATKDFQSDQEKINQKLLEKTKELQRSNEFLESYTYIASHDLKTPIRSISSFAKLLQKKLKTNEDPDVKDYLNFISTGTKQLHNIVDGIIENAMSNRSNLSYEMTDCTRLLQEIEQKMEVRLHHINGQLRYDRLPVVPADKNMLAKAFYYLIDNGFKYNHDENPQVRVTHRQSDGKHEFAVSDNGIGIPNRFRKDIFKMFKKLHPQQEYEGSGVGLALCKKIIELHGGKLWLDIKTKHGSTFYFSLPLSGKAPSKNPL